MLASVVDDGKVAEEKDGLERTRGNLSGEGRERVRARCTQGL